MDMNKLVDSFLESSKNYEKFFQELISTDIPQINRPESGAVPSDEREAEDSDVMGLLNKAKSDNYENLQV